MSTIRIVEKISNNEETWYEVVEKEGTDLFFCLVEKTNKKGEVERYPLSWFVPIGKMFTPLEPKEIEEVERQFSKL